MEKGLDFSGKTVLVTGIGEGIHDVLVNNAGITGTAAYDDPDLMSDFDKVMSTNLRAVVFLSHLVIPFLVKTKGSIVNISSILSTMTYPLPGGLSYSAAKAGLDMVSKHLALVLGPKEVRVNVVNPGAVNTNIRRRRGQSSEEVDAHYEASKKVNPLGMVGMPSDIAPAVAFLASENAAFVTGATFLIDGGFVLTTPMSVASQASNAK